MATIKKYFYIAKGENDTQPWLCYGEEAPIIDSKGGATTVGLNCEFIGLFRNNPIADSIKDNEIVKIYIRKETKKNK